MKESHNKELTEAVENLL